MSHSGNIYVRRWADAGWHRVDVRTGKGTPDPDVQTPNMDALIKDGIEMDRQCAMCWTRSVPPFVHHPFPRLTYLLLPRRIACCRNRRCV